MGLHHILFCPETKEHIDMGKSCARGFQMPDYAIVSFIFLHQGQTIQILNDSGFDSEDEESMEIDSWTKYT